MFSKNFSPSEMMAALQKLLPDEGQRSELEQALFNLVQGRLHHLDIVSREEFDRQNRVLMRTREKLEALENKLQKWESE